MYSKFHTRAKDEFLYQKGEQNGQGFFFLVSGKVELLVKSDANDEFKFSKGIDKGEFFGFRQTSYNEPRSDYARVTSDRAQFIELSVLKFQECISKT